MIEVIARQVAHPIKQCIDSELSGSPITREAQRNLPASTIDRLVAAEIQSATSDTSLSLIAVEVIGVQTSERFLTAAVTAIKQTLRGADVLFKYGTDQFIVLLPQTELPMAELIAARITDKLALFAQNTLLTRVR